MNMKTLAVVALVIVGLAAVPAASATSSPVAPQGDQSCSISGVVTTNPIGFNITVVGTFVSCILSP